MRYLVVMGLLLCGCGDDDAPADVGTDAADAGVDVGMDAGTDAGTDAGMLPRPMPGAFVEDEGWQHQAVFYELWLRSFQDSDGDGIGDFPGLTSRLDYLQELGVDALWLMPFFPSPLRDSGYDVANYVDVHEDYGTLADFDAFLVAAHERDLRVLVDLVFNHTSDQHEWFLQSQADPEGPFGDWFLWQDEAGEDCDGFAGPFGTVRWTRDDVRGQFYFHQFYPSQPDLNFENPEVREALLDVARFWLDRGVDGFRLDVPYRYLEDLPDCVHRPGTHAFLRDLRALTDSYDERVMVGEVLGDADILATYVEPDELHMVFMLIEAVLFDLASQNGSVSSVLDAAQRLAAVRPAGGAFSPIMGNHDFPRPAARHPDDDRRLRTLSGLQLTLPGPPFMYYGEEIGLGHGTEEIVDGRDEARTPMRWDATAAGGFTTGTPFLALAEGDRNVAQQAMDPTSLLAHYQTLIALRHTLPALATGELFTVLSGRRTAVYWRLHPSGDVLVAVNAQETPLVLQVPTPIRATAVPAGEAVDRVTGDVVGTVTADRLDLQIPAESTVVIAL